MTGKKYEVRVSVYQWDDEDMEDMVFSETVFETDSLREAAEMQGSLSLTARRTQ